MNVFKNQCVELRRQGLSMDEIAHILKRPRTSVYTHIRHLPLPKKRKEEAIRKNTERIVAFNRQRRGKSALGRKPQYFNEWTQQQVLLVGHLLFDGEISRTSCVYTNRNKALVNRMKVCMVSVYPYPPKETESSPGVQRISYHNVELASYLRKQREKLVNNISKMKPELQRVFLRAFFDDEGCIDFRTATKKRVVRGYQNDIPTLKLIQKLLKHFNIESRLAKSYVHEIVISGKDNLMTFHNEISFSPGVCINGKRKNSIWKQNLEKRNILRMAIDSYTT